MHTRTHTRPSVYCCSSTHDNILWRGELYSLGIMSKKGFAFRMKFRVHAGALCTYILAAAQKEIKVRTTYTYDTTLVWPRPCLNSAESGRKSGRMGDIKAERNENWKLPTTHTATRVIIGVAYYNAAAAYYTETVRDTD